MKSDEFQKILFRAAVLVMACDNEIHNDEIAEIKNIANQSAYFLDFDYENELKLILNEIQGKEKKAIDDFMQLLPNLPMKEKHKKAILYVVIKIILADNKIENSELQFLKNVKENIHIDDETILKEFPQHISLFNEDDNLTINQA